MPVSATAAKRRRRGLRAHAFILGVLAVLALIAASPSFAATLTVTVTGVHSDKGNVFVALFNSPRKFPDGDYSLRHLKVKASTSPIVVTFDHLPAGTYAVGCYHDENGNHKFDTNWFGYPVEGYALSNGIRAVISRPTFAATSFPVASPATQVTLHVKY